MKISHRVLRTKFFSVAMQLGAAEEKSQATFFQLRASPQTNFKAWGVEVELLLALSQMWLDKLRRFIFPISAKLLFNVSRLTKVS